MFRWMLEAVAQRLRGKSYRLDSNLPTASLLGIAWRRGICVLRGVLSFQSRKILFIGRGVQLRNRRFIRLGAGVTLGDGVLIDGLSREGVDIGRGVSIGPHTIIEATGVISNLGKGLSVGERSGIGAFSFIGAAGGVKIGRDVIMGQYVSFHSENHVIENLDVPIRQQGVTRVGIVIDDDCWVGAKVTFLDGVHVGTGAVVAAGAVVRGDVPPYSIVAGVPAKVVRMRGVVK